MSSSDVMNGANDDITPSDLIYLFVDGEASDLESTMLFNALVGDADLQSELADAIRINSAAQQEMFETLPPAPVTRALFRRVANLADQRRVGAATIPSAGIATNRSQKKNSAVRERRRNPLWIPILTGMLGVGIGLLLSSSNGILPGEEVAEVRIPTVKMQGGTLATTPSQDLQSEGLNGDRSEVSRNEASRSTREATAREGEAIASEATVDPTSSVSVWEDEAATDPTLTSEFSKEVQILPEHTDGDGTASSRGSLLEELAVTNAYLGSEYENPIIRLETEEVDSYDLLAVTPSNRFEPDNRMKEEKDQQLSFFLLAGNQVTFTPDRPAVQEATGENLQNLAIGGYFQVDDAHGVGIQGGRDFHPFYHYERRGVSTMLEVGSGNPAKNDPVILNHVGGGGIGGNPVIGFGGEGDATEAENLLNLGNGSGQTSTQGRDGVPSEELRTVAVSTLDPTIEWIGLGYRFRAPGIDRAGLFRPELQAALGLSTVGPVARATLALAWKPGTHVTLLAGVEGTGVFYRLDEGMYWSRRVGVVYGVGVSY